MTTLKLSAYDHLLAKSLFAEIGHSFFTAATSVVLSRASPTSRFSIFCRTSAPSGASYTSYYLYIEPILPLQNNTRTSIKLLAIDNPYRLLQLQNHSSLVFCLNLLTTSSSRFSSARYEHKPDETSLRSLPLTTIFFLQNQLPNNSHQFLPQQVMPLQLNKGLHQFPEKEEFTNRAFYYTRSITCNNNTINTNVFSAAFTTPLHNMTTFSASFLLHGS
ncbi:hypothetical protein ACSQ67_017911 [Phaseolus vulgaris]